MKCPKCRTTLRIPAPRADGLPGILYRDCLACGHSEAVTRRARRERLPDAAPSISAPIAPERRPDPAPRTLEELRRVRVRDMTNAERRLVFREAAEKLKAEIEGNRPAIEKILREED